MGKRSLKIIENLVPLENFGTVSYFLSVVNIAQLWDPRSNIAITFGTEKLHRVSKNCSFLLLIELRQISTNFNVLVSRRQSG